MVMTFEDRLRDRSRWTIGDNCSVVKVLDLLNTKTAFLAIRECFYGTMRFEDFVERVGASAPAVSRALRQLESAGVVSRVPYREPGQRARDEYRLTAAGEDLLPVLLSIIQWGDTHLQEDGPPFTFRDEAGRPLAVRVTAADREPPISADDIEIHYNGGRG